MVGSWYAGSAMLVADGFGWVAVRVGAGTTPTRLGAGDAAALRLGAALGLDSGLGVGLSPAGLGVDAGDDVTGVGVGLFAATGLPSPLATTAH